MKIWTSYGSEHSMNLVMIGCFKEVRDAQKAKRLIDMIGEQVGRDPTLCRWDAHPQDRRYSDAIMEIFKKVDIYTLSPTELEQFISDVHVRVDGNRIEITTDEIDVSAFLKVLLHQGARVEVYSAHEYPDDADAS